MGMGVEGVDWAAVQAWLDCALSSSPSKLHKTQSQNNSNRAFQRKPELRDLAKVNQGSVRLEVNASTRNKKDSGVGELKSQDTHLGS